MSTETPRTRRPHRWLRLLAPLAVVALLLTGATAAFASGAFETADSGLDTPRDIAEHGATAASPTAATSTSAPDDHGDDHGDDRGTSPGDDDSSRVTGDDAPQPVTVSAPRADDSGPGGADSGRDGADDGPGHDAGDDSGHSGSGHDGPDDSGHSGSGHDGRDDSGSGHDG